MLRLRIGWATMLRLGVLVVGLRMLHPETRGDSILLHLLRRLRDRIEGELVGERERVCCFTRRTKVAEASV